MSFLSNPSRDSWGTWQSITTISAIQPRIAFLTVPSRDPWGTWESITTLAHSYEAEMVVYYLGLIAMGKSLAIHK